MNLDAYCAKCRNIVDMTLSFFGVIILNCGKKIDFVKKFSISKESF